MTVKNCPFESFSFKHALFAGHYRSFGGFASDEDALENAHQLRQDLGAAGKEFVENQFDAAGYDAPWDLFNRHNEVWVRAPWGLADPESSVPHSYGVASFYFEVPVYCIFPCISYDEMRVRCYCFSLNHWIHISFCAIQMRKHFWSCLTGL